MPDSKPYQDLWNLAKAYSVVNIQCPTPYPDMTPGLVPDTNENAQNIGILKPSPVCITKSWLGLSNKMRMLWEQHIFWTVSAIKSIVENSPYKDLVIKRLLRNPTDFENALRPLYGSNTAKNFSDLFTSHLVIASELVNASAAGNTQAAADAEKRWYANADDIASFLASINPYWSKDGWKRMLLEHLDLTKSEAVYWITRDYNKAIAIYDDIQMNALGMADMMTAGITRQFPDMFME